MVYIRKAGGELGGVSLDGILPLSGCPGDVRDRSMCLAGASVVHATQPLPSFSSSPTCYNPLDLYPPPLQVDSNCIQRSDCSSVDKMKVLASSSLLIGACAASSPLQHVLQAPKQAAEALAKSKPIDNLQKSLKSMPAEARAAWEEVAMIYPEALEQALHVPPPKKHTRKPDSEWDHIIRGADVQSVWVKNEHGEDERDVDGKLEAYDLRTKKVDPSALGVDPNVTQFSGYLDDNDNDKHLFYCKGLS